MTFAELQTEFYARGFDYLNDSTAGQTRAKRWINQAYSELCALYPWPFLETSGIDDAPITFDDNTFLMANILSVVDETNDVKLTYMDRRSLLDLYPDLTTAGNPTYWYLTRSAAAEDVLYTYPRSTTAQIRVTWVRDPAEMSIDADEPLVPARFHDVIIDGAVIKAYKDDDEFDVVAKLRAEYDRSVLVMVNSLMNRHFDNSDRIVVRGGE